MSVVAFTIKPHEKTQVSLLFSNVVGSLYLQKIGFQMRYIVKKYNKIMSEQYFCCCSDRPDNLSVIFIDIIPRK